MYWLDLNRDNIKKLLLIIVFAIAVFTAFQRIDKIFYYIGLTLSISLPFIIGGAIAFILNVPMNAIEKYIFNNKKIFKKLPNKSKYRPISLILSIILVVLIFSGVINTVVP